MISKKLVSSVIVAMMIMVIFTLAMLAVVNDISDAMGSASFVVWIYVGAMITSIDPDNWVGRDA